MKKVNTIRAYPDFIGIGAQRSGTTWLWRALSKHSGTALPQVKELHYFDRDITAGGSVLRETRLVNRYFGLSKASQRSRKKLFRDVARSIRSMSLHRIQWVARYYDHVPNDGWYLSLFDRPDGLITGDITPSYSLLSVEKIRHIKSLMPDVRILLIIRDPIERIWSSFLFGHRRNSYPDSTFKPDKLRDAVLRPASIERGYYTKVIQRWLSVFPAEQLFIGFYDDIKKDPLAVFRQVLQHLNLALPHDYPVESLARRVNASEPRSIPYDLEQYIAVLYLDELRSLAEMIPGYPTIWYRRALTLANNAGLDR